MWLERTPSFVIHKNSLPHTINACSIKRRRRRKGFFRKIHYFNCSCAPYGSEMHQTYLLFALQTHTLLNPMCAHEKLRERLRPAQKTCSMTRSHKTALSSHHSKSCIMCCVAGFLVGDFAINLHDYSNKSL